MTKKLYYIQYSGEYVGNCLIWWGKDRKGYTTDISKAGVYTRKEAYGQHESRAKDIPWSKEYIDTKTQPTVDCQSLERSEGR